MSNYAIFYHPDTVLTTYEFDTTRKGHAIAAQLQNDGITVRTPDPLRPEEAMLIHTHEYVNAIRNGQPEHLATSQGFDWDAQMWNSVAAQNGAMRDAALAAIAGTPAYAISAGFHHARRTKGAGFCTLNGLALAAHVAHRQGVRQTIILDVDAHHGGGTYSMVHQWPDVRHVDIATSPYDGYDTDEPHRSYYVASAKDYLDTLQYALRDIEAALQPGDLLIYNAGMDSHELCRMGSLYGVTTALLTQREALVATWARQHQLRMMACLAGGYADEIFTTDELYGLHCMSVKTFLQITD